MQDSIAYILKKGRDVLASANVENPGLDAMLLLCDVLGKPKEYVIAYPDRELSIGEISAFFSFIERRSLAEPISYILGQKEFWGINFKVNSTTLTPRPDSETLIEAVISLFKDKTSKINILDLGTGSGCLLLSLLKEYPNAYGVGVDVSSDALEIAYENASSLKLSNRVSFVNCNWNDFHNDSISFDLIISNPPYIPGSIVETLSDDVRLYEPKLALDGGRDGLDCYRQILSSLSKYSGKAAKTTLVFEVGMGQSNAVVELARLHNIDYHVCYKDLSMVERCVSFTVSSKKQ